MWVHTYLALRLKDPLQSRAYQVGVHIPTFIKGSLLLYGTDILRAGYHGRFKITKEGS